MHTSTRCDCAEVLSVVHRIHAYIHAYTHACIQACRGSERCHTCILLHAYIHAMHTSTHIHWGVLSVVIHAYMHAYTHACIPACRGSERRHTCVLHAYTHACIQACRGSERRHTCIHISVHAYTLSILLYIFAQRVWVHLRWCGICMERHSMWFWWASMHTHTQVPSSSNVMVSWWQLSYPDVSWWIKFNFPCWNPLIQGWVYSTCTFLCQHHENEGAVHKMF